MSKRFYITCPIYYPSAKPHVGTAYTTVLSDVLTRYKKLLGYDAFLTVGTDEHALKILTNAKKAGKEPMDFLNDFYVVFKELWKKLDINYDTFIRTTDKKHEDVVKKVYAKIDELGLIELKKWNGWYCNSCEENYAMNNIVKNGEQFFCNQGHLLVDRSEDSLFFKLSKFTDWTYNLLYKEKPDFIYPEERRNELYNSFIKGGLEDLSITRISQDWGIEVLADKYKSPEGKTHVAYVWIDALFSYLSALNFLQPDDSNYQKFWNNDESVIIHFMSKEIVRFNAIFWPIFLHTLGLRLPSKIISHGWIVTPEGKMSKSLGNVIDPNEYIDAYGSDALRFFFVKGLILENDSIFSKDRFIEVYNTYLANTIGNLANRVHSMVKKFCGGTVPMFYFAENYRTEFIGLLRISQECNAKIENNDSVGVVDTIIKLGEWVNKFIEQEKPWELFAQHHEGKLNELISLLVNIVRTTFYYLSPVLTKSCKIILQGFGIDINSITQSNINNFHECNGKTLNNLPILFPRIDQAKNK